MSTYEYYHVFETILFAGVLTLIVQGWAQLIKHKKEYKIYWSYLLGSITFAVFVVWRYYLFQTFAIYEVINSGMDFLVLIFVPAASLLLGAQIYFPNDYHEIDLKKYIQDNRFWISQHIIIVTLTMAYHTHLIKGLDLDAIFGTVFTVVGFSLFIITKKIRVFEAMMIAGVFNLTYWLLKDDSYFLITK